LQGFSEERLKGLEPSSFCMAIGSSGVPMCRFILQTAYILVKLSDASITANGGISRWVS
jgi:hypothetical protein